MCKVPFKKEIGLLGNNLLAETALSMLNLKFRKQAEKVVRTQTAPLKEYEVVLGTSSSALKSTIRCIGGSLYFSSQKDHRNSWNIP